MKRKDFLKKYGPRWAREMEFISKLFSRPATEVFTQFDQRSAPKD